MKCVKLKGQRKLEVGELEDSISKNGNVVIEVKKTGICGSDLHFWNLGQMIDLVLGHEFSGVVIDPGSREDLKVGDRVTALPFSPCGKCQGCKVRHGRSCFGGVGARSEVPRLCVWSQERPPAPLGRLPPPRA